jgi:RimJ/RimL family protein N-acetyltransferase
MVIKPVTLEGKTVNLVPLTMAHVGDLTLSGNNPTIWLYMRYGFVDTEAKMAELIQTLLKLQELRTDLPFTVILRKTGQAVGMTRYMDIQEKNLSLEIGGTWYSNACQRTGVNTECKFLLLDHAFEVLGVNRVQFKADLRNERSQRAIERIGAVREGVLRDHMILPDGYVRSSVYYSILKSEWPAVNLKLSQKMHSY